MSKCNPQQIVEFRRDDRTMQWNPYTLHDVSGDTEEAMFKNFYASYERTYRYCNDVSFKFVDAEVQKRYIDWKNYGGITIDLYYGSATVD